MELFGTPFCTRGCLVLAKVNSCAIVGLDGALVDVEVDLSNGQPGFTKAGSETQTKCPA